MKKAITHYLFLISLIVLSLVLPSLSSAGVSPPPAAQAFKLSASLGDSIVKLHWQLEPGFYLYKDRLHFLLVEPKTASVGSILLPPGTPKTDKFFGTFRAYQNAVTVSIPILNAKNQNIILRVDYQGCSAAGYCYPPARRQIMANFQQQTVQITELELGQDSSADSTSSSTISAKVNSNEPITSQDQVTQLLATQSLGMVLIAFLGFGLLLAFTPCVLPMIPILSSIIVGHQATLTTGKAFRLSLVYVLSMAFTYALAGILVGHLGGSVQVIFQKPWVIALFSGIFILLALSMFGFYNLELPQALRQKLANLSNKQAHGHYLGVAIMGCLATLIVSPCVTPALVGALSYIGQTGNALLGGAALFMMGLGMGLPLLIIGTSGGKLLPKAGQWMNSVKYGIGVLLLVVAIILLNRIILGTLGLLLWAGLFIVTAIYMGAFKTQHPNGWSKLWQGLGLLVLIYGILLIVGAAMGNTNPLKPIALKMSNSQTNSGAKTSSFQVVHNLAEANQAFALAKKQNRPVLLDFYADWCIACKEMEYETFSDPKVKAALANYVLLKVDMTQNNLEDKKLLKHFQVTAPPTLLFFNAAGTEIKNLRVVGAISAKKFLQILTP